MSDEENVVFDDVLTAERGNEVDPTEEKVESLKDVGLFSGDTKKGLQKLRRKLLDITKRNALLNYRHPKHVVRVIDEIPDYLFNALQSEQSFKILPIKPPDEDDLSEEVLSKLKQLKGRDKAVFIAKDIYGMNTSYDLAEPDKQSPAQKRHTDSYIQTLLSPDDLEEIMGEINRSTQLAIQETGSNFLHLAFGFLEWYESESSDSVRHAPLVLVPVEIRRKLEKGIYLYELSYNGEDLMPNLSLIEMLKENQGLSLPEFDDLDDVRDYWNKCRHVIREKKKWKIRQCVTLGLFQFRKLLMYKDLDPKNWPSGDAIDSNPLVKMFFEGEMRSASNGNGEYHIDGHADCDLPLIEDADSSQHSALIDALNGKNLVIEGPPGTGKSQTITNLIAAAISKGKKVLFVSEKLAALKVVKQRLDRNGLGDFCLELHSEKTKKQDLFHSISQRLDKKFNFNAKEYTRQLDDLRLHRQKLSDLIVALESRCDHFEITNQELLIKAGQCDLHAQKALSKSPHDFLRLRSPIPLVFPADKHGFLSRLVRDFEAFSKDVAGANENPAHSAWYGVALSHKPKQATSQIIHDLISLRTVSNETLQIIKDVNDQYSTVIKDDLAQLRELFDAIKKVESLPKNIWVDILKHFDGSADKPIRKFLLDLKGIRSSEIKIKNSTSQSFDVYTYGEPIVDCLHKLESVLSTHGFTKSDLKSLHEELVQFEESLSKVSESTENVSKIFDIQVPLSLFSLVVIKYIGECLRITPYDDLRHRSANLKSSLIKPLLETGETTQGELNKSLESLQSKFHMELIPEDNNSLIEIVRELTDSHFFSFFSPKWRKSKKLYKSFQLDKKTKFDPSKACTDINSILTYRKKLSSFEKDTHLVSALGTQFEGISTDFAALKRVVEWYELISSSFPLGGDEIFNGLVDKIFGMEVRHMHMLTANLNESFDAHSHKPIALLDGTLQVRIDILEACKTWRELSDLVKQVDSILVESMHLWESSALSDDMTLDSLQRIVPTIQSHISLANSLNNSELQGILNGHFEGYHTSDKALSETIDFYDLIVSTNLPDIFKKALIASQSGSEYSQVTAYLLYVAQAIQHFENTLNQFKESSGVNLDIWTRSKSNSIQAILHAIHESLNNESQLDAYLNFASNVGECLSHQLDPLLNLVFEEKLHYSDSHIILDFATYVPLAESMLRKYPSLKKSSVELDRLRKDFSEADKNVQKLGRLLLASKIAATPLPAGINSARASDRTDMALINHHLGLERHRLTIRNLCSRAGSALVAMKPCFMMGPLAVAQFLSRGHLKFDIVIMDEASQMRPEDALGAVARGMQIVIVGDPKQLPPTSFFDRGISDDQEEDSESVLHESESILEAAAGLLQPTRQLKWHYRSQHESLIAFSNKEFYNGNLVVFPSPHGSHHAYGVKYHHVQGVYHGSKNEKEAETVARALIDHYKANKDESLGVVAMNIQQAKLIEEVYGKMLKAEPHLQEIIGNANSQLEPLFIKNLENVQGDERDVILISATYGPDETGVIQKRFGPVNFRSGWRRLNVLFTRARKRIHLYASMSHEELALDSTASFGARSFKNYLQFAKEGKLTSERETSRLPDSPFEEEVAAALMEKGFECVPQLGVANFFIDIVIRNPKLPGSYVLGIECDGATYHSSKSARDRDRLRQQVLENMNWNIHRVWSTDWFRNPKREIDKILQRLDSLLIQ